MRREENLKKSDGLGEGREVRFGDVQDRYSHDQSLKRIFSFGNTFGVSFSNSPAVHIDE